MSIILKIFKEFIIRFSKTNFLLILSKFEVIINHNIIFFEFPSSGYLIGNMSIRYHGREAFHGAGFGRVND